MKKIIVTVFSDVIYTDGDFGFISKPIMFGKRDDFNSLHKCSDTYGLSFVDRYTNKSIKDWKNRTYLIDVHNMLGFVDLDPDDRGHYYEFSPYRIEIPLDDYSCFNDNIAESEAKKIASDFIEFISWYMIKCIHGKWSVINTYLEYFGSLITNDLVLDTELSKSYSYEFTGNTSGKITIKIEMEE